MAEDNLPDAILVRHAVSAESLPLEIFHVVDGEQAAQFISKAEQDPNAPQPHILLIDINLPKRTGFEVLESIRASARWKQMPVLVFTSSDARADRDRAASLHATYFRKPPNLQEFMMLGGRIRELLVTSGLMRS